MSVIVEGQKTSDSVWMPFNGIHRLANTNEDIARNIEHALTLDYLSFEELLGTQEGAVAVVGSGPSLKKNWKKLRNFKGDIIACNAACKFLLDKGIVPKYMFCFDADPLMLEFVIPHPGITYLLASRCPPKAFEMLKGCQLFIWHASGDVDLERLLVEAGKYEPMISGGGAAVSRCMVLAQTLGYSTIHIWGADSCFVSGETHIGKSPAVQRHIFINAGGREFETAPWMALQVEDFKKLAPPLQESYGIKFVIHGDGLLPQIAASMGFKVDWQLAIKQFFRQWKWNFNMIWKTI